MTAAFASLAVGPRPAVSQRDAGVVLRALRSGAVPSGGAGPPGAGDAGRPRRSGARRLGVQPAGARVARLRAAPASSRSPSTPRASRSPSERPALEQILDDGLVNFLFVGRIAPNKKIEDHIRLAEHYKRYVDAYYRFIFVGRFDVVPRYYSMIRALMAEYRLLERSLHLHRPGSRRGARRLLPPCGRLHLAERARGVLRAAGRSDGGRRAGARLCRGGRPGHARRRRRAVRAEGSRVRRRAARRAGVRRRPARRRSSPASAGGWRTSATRASRASSTALRPSHSREESPSSSSATAPRCSADPSSSAGCVAERLRRTHDVEVLTTCARDYVTWKNEYPEGADRIRGVTVRRFANARDARHRGVQQVLGLDLQQPAQPRRRDGVAEAAGAVVSGAHRIPAAAPSAVRRPDLLHVSVRADGARPRGRRRRAASWCRPRTTSRRSGSEIFKDVFSRPAALCYLTESERRFVQMQFPERPLLEEVIGVGVDMPQQQPYPRMPARGRRRRRPRRRRRRQPPTARTKKRRRASSRRTCSRAAPCSAAATGCTARSLLYGGRIDPGKGCEELIEYFSEYVKEGGDATLALMGVKLMSLPEEPFIRFAGLLSRPRAAAGARSGDRRRLPVAVREPVAARARGAVGRHAGARQRAQRGAGRALRRAATAACTTPTATSSWSA